MTIEQFATWAAFFREQLVRGNESSEWLDDWFDDVKNCDFDDAMEAVRMLRKNMTRWDVAQRSLTRLLGYIDSLASKRVKRGSPQLETYREWWKNRAINPEGFSMAELHEKIVQARSRGDQRSVAEIREEYLAELQQPKKKKRGKRV